MLERFALPEQAKLDAAIERLARMTPDEIMAKSIADGIHKPNGELTPEYGGALT